MHKKLIMACMAIAAFAAFVIAPAASASPVLTNAESKAVATGTSITGVNEGITTFTATGLNVECSKDHLVGTVTKNSGTKIEGTIPVGSASFKGTGTGEDCTSNLGSTKVAVTSELCLEASGTADVVTVTGCGGASVKFDLEVTGTGNCEYSAASISGTHTTAPNDAKVTIVKGGPANKIAGGIFCPSSGTLDMVFNLTTSVGGTLTVS